MHCTIKMSRSDKTQVYQTKTCDENTSNKNTEVTGEYMHVTNMRIKLRHDELEA